jgi:hypothetical protein
MLTDPEFDHSLQLDAGYQGDVGANEIKEGIIKLANELKRRPARRRRWM